MPILVKIKSNINYCESLDGSCTYRIKNPNHGFKSGTVVCINTKRYADTVHPITVTQIHDTVYIDGGWHLTTDIYKYPKPLPKNSGIEYNMEIINKILTYEARLKEVKSKWDNRYTYIVFHSNRLEDYLDYEKRIKTMDYSFTMWYRFLPNYYGAIGNAKDVLEKAKISALEIHNIIKNSWFNITFDKSYSGSGPDMSSSERRGIEDSGWVNFIANNIPDGYFQSDQELTNVQTLELLKAHTDIKIYIDSLTQVKTFIVPEVLREYFYDICSIYRTNYYLLREQLDNNKLSNFN